MDHETTVNVIDPRAVVAQVIEHAPAIKSAVAAVTADEPLPGDPAVLGMVEAYHDFVCDLSRAADAGDDSRVRRFVASTGARDRYGDEIPPSAWDTKWYQRNPVVLWGHNYRDLPIGKAIKVEVTDKALVIDVEFAGADANPLSEQVLKLYDGGFLRAVSVGFRSKASEWIDPTDEDEAKKLKKEPDNRPGKRFTKVELLELSCVPVPANPEALMQARKKGLDVPDARFCRVIYMPSLPVEAAATGETKAEQAAADEASDDGAAVTEQSSIAESQGAPDTGPSELDNALAVELLDLLAYELKH